MNLYFKVLPLDLIAKEGNDSCSVLGEEYGRGLSIPIP